MPAPPHATLIYDGQCGFCRIWLEYWQALLGDRLEYLPYQQIGDRFPSLDRAALTTAVHLVTRDGAVYPGAHAVFQSLSPVALRYRILLWLYTRIAVFRGAANLTYAWISAHRDFAYHATALVFGKPIRPQTWKISESIFLRLLALSYCFAFASLRPQIVGLVGSHGLSPVTPILDAIRAAYGTHAYFLVPSFAWLRSSDQSLVLLCSLGIFFAALLFFNFLARLSALACFLLYLSVSSVGQPFTLFQWDALLLEAGFLALFSGLPWLNWMYRLLAFRLLLESGLVKLLSGDPNWRNLHALRFHFFTQPLPTPLAWYFAQAPHWFLDSLTALVLFIELPVPFLLLCPRRLRHWGAGLLVALQAIIALTGNYAFFNLLTVAILLWAFEDQFFQQLTRGFVAAVRARAWARPFLRWLAPPPSPRLPGVRLVSGAICLLLAVIGLGQLGSIAVTHNLPVLVDIERQFAPFEIVNRYGLFAVMTTERPEIIYEGSNDGVDWREYQFPYKPGSLRRSLPIVAPFQPRLDWQLWFAAMESLGQNPWAGTLAIRILEGEPSVLRLLGPPPFAHPPKFMRALLYQYEFTSREERSRTGNIWKRQPLGVYIPKFSLADVSGAGESQPSQSP